MASIIGVIQIKGGAGRSTVATNLAALMANHKKNVLLDCDMPQATSSSWYAIRQAEIPLFEGLALATANNLNSLVEKVKQLNPLNDFIVIDAPPRIAAITRATLILSNLCLIPLGASAAEIWATTDLLETIREAKEEEPGIDARIVWNRYRANTNAAKELSAAVHKELGLKEMQSRLGYRVAYSEALARGLAVTEWPDTKAKEEMLSLAREVERILKVKIL